MVSRQQVAAGIDVGSLSAEAVLLAGDGVIAYAIVPTGADSKRAAEKALHAALQSAGMQFDDLAMIVATGYGRISVPFAHKRITEITCHGRGAFFLHPAARTVIDVGGQDSKAIRLDDKGRVLDFAMNDKCAAGTGRFLEVMAAALEVELDQLAALSAKAPGDPISSTCTVLPSPRWSPSWLPGSRGRRLPGGCTSPSPRASPAWFTGWGLRKRSS